MIAISAEKPNAPLHNCTLGKRYNAAHSHLVYHPQFESAVIKLQESCPQDLTDGEKAAVECLKVVEDSRSSIADDKNGEVLSMRERQDKRRKVAVTFREYIPFGFLLGSVAELERVWSI